VKELTYTLVLLAGVLVTVQAAINARLGHELGNNMQAVLISFLVGTLGAVLICLVQGGKLPAAAAMRGGPWWMWTGGLLGVAFVWCTVWAVPKIGVSVMFPLVVAGQMAAALVMEQFGLLGSPTQPVSLGRVGGVLLVVAGAVVMSLTRSSAPAE
jgi:transporter family-2 protein